MKAMYTFTGDPITYGHMDIIKRAARMFNHLTVGFGINLSKSPLFLLEERMQMARVALQDLVNVDVVAYDTLTVNYAYDNGIGVIVKGVRDSKDFEYEKNIHQNGGTQGLGIETIVVMTGRELEHISSTAVKVMQLGGGLIHTYVPLNVKQKLEEKLSGQYVVGLCGDKVDRGFLARIFKDLSKIPVHEVGVDDLVKEHKGNPNILYKNIKKRFGRERGLMLMSCRDVLEEKLLLMCNNNVVLASKNDGMGERLRREMDGMKYGMLLSGKGYGIMRSELFRGLGIE